MELGVNIDHVATLREARRIDIPDPIAAARFSELGGADSIVCHLREDRRHIQDRDLRRLKKSVSVKLNLEMAASQDIVEIACAVRPDQATLVPEKRRELTTEGGLDVIGGSKRITRVIKKLDAARIKVSLFIDPDRHQIKAARSAGVRMVELHAGNYASARGARNIKKEYSVLRKAARYGKSIGLKVFAGHGLNYANIKRLLPIKEIEEYNIGHSIVARAVFVGIEKAVREMKALIS
ncbi:MAG: pyridoxine 5'-phosphate synthase [Candidatus Omnitrophica bacterium]|nr:pyridoxine 5'-phosphate synthase [Candidatus Omnitrophota bacterium]